MCRAFHNDSVDRDALAGTNHHPIGCAYSVQRKILLDIPPTHARRLWAQRLKRSNSCGRLSLGSMLEVLAKQHERNHDSRGFEVEMGHF